MTVRIAASLWSVPVDQQAHAAARLVAEGVERFHWDLADGTMGRSGGFSADEANQLAGSVAGEAHLMCEDPRPQLGEWIAFCDTIAVHSSQPHWVECIRTIQAAGVKPVVAVTSATELSSLDLDQSWGVLVMSVIPGHAGSTFDPRAVETVRLARRLGHALVGVDGSVDAQRGAALVAAGATWIVSGTSLTASDPAVWREEVLARSGIVPRADEAVLTGTMPGIVTARSSERTDLKCPGSDGDSRYLSPTSGLQSLGTAENAFSNSTSGTLSR